MRETNGVRFSDRSYVPSKAVVMQDDKLARPLLKLYSIATGLQLAAVPAEVLARWSAEAATGHYDIGVPNNPDHAPALCLIIGAGRMLASADCELDRHVVSELLREALTEITVSVRSGDCGAEGGNLVE